jgi:hypothetical protein
MVEHPTHAGVILQFIVYAFQFCWGVSIELGLHLGLCSGGLVGESCMVHVAHLLGLQVYGGSFETSQQGKMTCHFSKGRHFLRLGSV